MAESYKFDEKGLAGALEVYPDLPWKASAGGDVWVYNSKEEEFVPVAQGQFIVSIADRYEVHDEEPKRAKPAEPVQDEEPVVAPGEPTFDTEQKVK